MKVFIVNSSPAYVAMYVNEGWSVVNELVKADLVQFTGGADVSPYLYDELPHSTTSSDAYRDEQERSIYFACLEAGISMAGICRGGQFLNVMNGGKLWQDVDNHAHLVGHEVYDLWTHQVVPCSSTHHQMIRPAEEGVVIAVAHNLATYKERVIPDGVLRYTVPKKEEEEDVEVVYYPGTDCLCFQPHPEMNEWDGCRELYFDYIHSYIFNGEE